jgi:hypothetical protein
MVCWDVTRARDQLFQIPQIGGDHDRSLDVPADRVPLLPWVCPIWKVHEATKGCTPSGSSIGAGGALLGRQDGCHSPVCLS